MDTFISFSDSTLLLGVGTVLLPTLWERRQDVMKGIR